MYDYLPDLLAMIIVVSFCCCLVSRRDQAQRAFLDYNLRSPRSTWCYGMHVKTLMSASPSAGPQLEDGRTISRWKVRKLHSHVVRDMCIAHISALEEVLTINHISFTPWTIMKKKVTIQGNIHIA